MNHQAHDPAGEGTELRGMRRGLKERGLARRAPGRPGLGELREAPLPHHSSRRLIPAAPGPPDPQVRQTHGLQLLQPVLHPGPSAGGGEHRVPGERVPGELPGAAAGAGRGAGAASAGGGGRRPLTRRSVRGHRGPPRRPLRPPPAPRSKSGSRTSAGSAPARPSTRPVPGPRPALLLKGTAHALQRHPVCLGIPRSRSLLGGAQPRRAEKKRRDLPGFDSIFSVLPSADSSR